MAVAIGGVGGQSWNASIKQTSLITPSPGDAQSNPQSAPFPPNFLPPFLALLTGAPPDQGVFSPFPLPALRNGDSGLFLEVSFLPFSRWRPEPRNILTPAFPFPHFCFSSQKKPKTFKGRKISRCREFTKEMHGFVSKHPQSDLGVPVRPIKHASFRRQ